MNLREEDSPKDATRTGCLVTAATIENAKDKKTNQRRSSMNYGADTGSP